MKFNLIVDEYGTLTLFLESGEWTEDGWSNEFINKVNGALRGYGEACDITCDIQDDGVNPLSAWGLECGPAEYETIKLRLSEVEGLEFDPNLRLPLHLQLGLFGRPTELPESAYIGS